MSLEEKLQYTFQNPALLELALTHPSLGHERNQRLPHNERLEFLGDAVLALAISEHLYATYPEVPEGHLTKMRAHLVNRSALLEMANELELGAHLRLGEAEISQGGRKRVSSLANAFEAVIGAIFLDSDYATAHAFVLRQIGPRLESITDNPEPENAKGLLQEKLHLIGKTPIYRIVSENGPDHRKEFEASVELDGCVLGSGTANTKKEAEMRAAAVALKTLRKQGSED
jgi:ribonuclease-3